MVNDLRGFQKSITATKILKDAKRNGTILSKYCPVCFTENFIPYSLYDNVAQGCSCANCNADLTDIGFEKSSKKCLAYLSKIMDNKQIDNDQTANKSNKKSFSLTESEIRGLLKYNKSKKVKKALDEGRFHSRVILDALAQ